LLDSSVLLPSHLFQLSLLAIASVSSISVPSFALPFSSCLIPNPLTVTFNQSLIPQVLSSLVPAGGSDSNGVTIGLITGVIGGLLLLILLTVGFALFMKRYRSQTSEYGSSCSVNEMDYVWNMEALGDFVARVGSDVCTCENPDISDYICEAMEAMIGE
jgi:hypothetical protein